MWAIGYWIVYPAWPTLAGYTRGMLGYSQRGRCAERSGGAREPGPVSRQARRHATRPDQGRPGPPALRHGRRRGGLPDQLRALPRPRRPGLAGYPNLNDDDWLWGGTIEAIHKTISFGIRSDQKDTRTSQMPRYGLDKLSTTRRSTSGRVRALPVRQGTIPAAAARPEGLRRAVRRLSRRGRQGQSGAGRTQPHRHASGSTAAAGRPSSRPSGPDAAA